MGARHWFSGLIPLLFLGCAVGCGTPATEPPLTEPQPAWLQLDTGTTASLRGISVLDAEVVWASGSGGTVLRTLDAGESWEKLLVAGGEELDFRDIEAFDTETAVLMTAGQPARLYHTEDGGQSFSLAYECPQPEAFLDGLEFWDTERGLAFSDPVDGRFLILRTSDGGRSWQELTAATLPEPLPGEAGFAASGSSIQVASDGRAWIGLGGAAARVLRSIDFGDTWTVSETPLRRGVPSAGIFSLAARGDLVIAAGGDYQQPELSDGTLARSEDGGSTWTLATLPPPSGHRATVSFVDPTGNATTPAPPPGTTLLSVGRGGCDLSRDAGHTWERWTSIGFYTASVGNDGSYWAAGSDGRVARLYWILDGT